VEESIDVSMDANMANILNCLAEGDVDKDIAYYDIYRGTAVDLSWILSEDEIDEAHIYRSLLSHGCGRKKYY